MHVFVCSAISLFLLITFFATRERVVPSKQTQTHILKDLSDLVHNRPWIILLIIGFLFVTFNSIKQGITVIFFERKLGNVSLSAFYMVTLLVTSMIAALVTTPLSNRFGKRNLFIYSLLFAGMCNGMLYFAGGSVISVFVWGNLSEFGAGIMPVLFFAMLGDAADYSEYKNGRRATGLIYSAGTFAMKFGGGVAGAIMGIVLTVFGYEGMKSQTSPEALKGILLLMSWIPAVFSGLGAGVLLLYPITKHKMDEINQVLMVRRSAQDTRVNN